MWRGEPLPAVFGGECGWCGDKSGTYVGVGTSVNKLSRWLWIALGHL